MPKYLIVLNLCLVALVAVVGLKLRADWLGFDAAHDPASLEVLSESIELPAIGESIQGPVSAPPSTSIADQNLFSFDRNDVDFAVTNEVPISKARPILFGTMSLGEEPLALLAAGQIGNRDYRPVRVGEEVDGWELIEIAEKSVIVRFGETNVTVLLNDPTAQVPRSSTSTAVTRPPAPPRVSSPVRSVQAPTASASPGAESIEPRTRTVETPFGPYVIPVEP